MKEKNWVHWQSLLRTKKNGKQLARLILFNLELINATHPFLVEYVFVTVANDGDE